MALSNAERQRLHYQRQKDKKKGDLKQPDGADLPIRTEDPFYEWFQGQALMTIATPSRLQAR